MKIIIFAQHYAPEDVSGSVLGTELATDLVRAGHEVTFVTCAPNYPKGAVFEGYRNALIHIEILDGVRVIRTWSYISPRKTFWRRLLNYGTFSAFALIGGIRAGHADVILSFSPPLPLGLSAWLLSRLRRRPWILNVMDIYPEVAVATGVLRNRVAIRMFSMVELFLYRRASLIQVLSEGFKQNLMLKGVGESRLSIIPVWADPELVLPGERENAFRRAYSLEGKFVVMHTGNFGYNNSLEDLIGAAEVLRHDDRIRFVMIGEGARKQVLMAATKAKRLRNVVFLPYQPRESFSDVLAAADVGVVSLGADAHQTSFPSKTFNIMASARPLLVVAPEGSEVRTLVEDNACGVAVSPGRAADLAARLIALVDDKDALEVQGARGRSLLKDRFSRARCVARYEADFARVVSAGRTVMHGRPRATRRPGFAWRVGFGLSKMRSLARTVGLRQTARAVLSNALSVERMYRFSIDLGRPYDAVLTAAPVELRIVEPESDIEGWEGLRSIEEIRGEYGRAQCVQRLARGYVLFCAYIEGEFAGFIWLIPPPVVGVDAGVRLAPDEAYMIDGWTFVPHRGKRVLPFLQVAVFEYARTRLPGVRRIITHGAISNRSSVAGQLKAGFSIVAIDLSLSVFGYNTKRRIRRYACADGASPADEYRQRQERHS